MGIESIKKKLALNNGELKRRFGISELGVFGSYARGEQKKGSDIDVLVSYSKSPGLLGLLEAEEYISKLLGAKVDLVTKGSLKNPYVSKSILDEVVMV